jgi:predicted heme/steroid binding protein
MYRRILVCFLVLFPIVALANPGTAQGKITINGKAKDLTYAYAWKDGANTTVLLSDAKVDEKTLGDHFALTDLARKDKFTGVQATITPKGEVSTGTFYTAAEDGYFDAVGMHEWKKKAQSAGSIAGKLSTDHEHKFFKTSYSYSADFTAPIGPQPKKK